MVPDANQKKLATPRQRLVGRSKGVVGIGASPRLRTSCTYSKGGMCSQHGHGIEKFEPGHEMVVGKDGGLKKKYVKKKYWVCDLDMESGKKLRQPSINFKMTQNDRKGGNDGSAAMGGGSSNLSTSKVGQNKSYEHVAGSDVSQEISL